MGEEFLEKFIKMRIPRLTANFSLGQKLWVKSCNQNLSEAHQHHSEVLLNNC